MRLRYGYIVECVGCDKDPATGEVTAVHCRYDPGTRGGDAPDNRKVKGTIHWVSAARGLCPWRRGSSTISFWPTAPWTWPREIDWVATVNKDSLEVVV